MAKVVQRHAIVSTMAVVIQSTVNVIVVQDGLVNRVKRNVILGHSDKTAHSLVSVNNQKLSLAILSMVNVYAKQNIVEVKQSNMLVLDVKVHVH